MPEMPRWWGRRAFLPGCLPWGSYCYPQGAYLSPPALQSALGFCPRRAHLLYPSSGEAQECCLLGEQRQGKVAFQAQKLWAVGRGEPVIISISLGPADRSTWGGVAETHGVFCLTGWMLCDCGESLNLSVPPWSLLIFFFTLLLFMFNSGIAGLSTEHPEQSVFLPPWLSRSQNLPTVDQKEKNLNCISSEHIQTLIPK